jgi:hypothetical protein
MSVAMRLIEVLAGIPEVLETFQLFNLVKAKFPTALALDS